MAASSCQRPKRLRTLEAENATLKKLLADAVMDKRNAQGDCHKKIVPPAVRREAVTQLRVRGERTAGVRSSRSRPQLDRLPQLPSRDASVGLGCASWPTFAVGLGIAACIC
jgi:hypothetical protein